MEATFSGTLVGLSCDRLVWACGSGGGWCGHAAAGRWVSAAMRAEVHVQTHKRDTTTAAGTSRRCCPPRQPLGVGFRV
eukprot:16862-Chlamydomonas_euryale.AAC.2